MSGGFCFQNQSFTGEFSNGGGRFANETPDECQTRTSHFVPGLSCQMRLKWLPAACGK